MEGQRGRLTRLAVALVAVSLVGVVTACGPSDATPTRTATSASETPSNTATPTPTPLTEEEAYAAAEATYRAYIDALNDLDFADPATFEPVFALTSGEVNDADQQWIERFRQAGFTMTGVNEITLLEPSHWDPVTRTATLISCLDITTIDVLDVNGVSQVSPDRPNVQGFTVKTVQAEDSATPLLVGVDARFGDPACPSS